MSSLRTTESSSNSKSPLSQCLAISLIGLTLLLAGCAEPVPRESCPVFQREDMLREEVFAANDSFTFRFPLDGMADLAAFEATLDFRPAPFCAYGSRSESSHQFHAAEDYYQPAGTPVYAIADGEVSFSGRMGGYGWLVIVEHPQANLYSLYGHLSPSRWYIDSRTEVEKGDLLGYLGDSDENGGSAQNPLPTHLHFGIRAGQTSDYPVRGVWRWMAGWIELCPADLGWMRPSQVINDQEIPAGGFPEPSANLLQRWSVELAFTGAYVLIGLCAIVFAIVKDKPAVMLIYSVAFIALGLYLNARGWQLYYLFLAMAALLLALGIYMYRRRQAGEVPPQS